MMFIKKLLIYCYAIILGLLPHVSFASPTIDKINIFTGTDYANLLLEVSDIDGEVTMEVVINKSGTLLWKGHKTVDIFDRDSMKYVSMTINDINPQLWTPASPVLYDLTVSLSQNGVLKTKESERIGFRSFESKNGQILLNGNPIFLRGIAINPPGRGIPDELEKSRQFAYDYVRFMKSINVNIIRIPDDETWYDVCDELGMMVFGGNYGGTIGGRKPPKDYEWGIKWFRTKKYNKISHHPSLMIYAITNETPYKGEIAVKWENFTKYAHQKLKSDWDSTRLYIGNAGYGYGKSGDICDLHRYWGWYYSSPYTFLNIRDNSKIIPFKKPVQPITFTECVGNYSGPDGRYNLTPDHKNPVSQLCWTGHAPQNIQAQLASEHQVHTFKQATELFRRLRPSNSELSGIFPFTILFHNWHTIENFTDMSPKAVAFQAKTSYAPVLLSWEVWTPNVYTGSKFSARFHIVNDSDSFEQLEGGVLSYELIDTSGKPYFSGIQNLPKIAYYDTYSSDLVIELPSVMPSGQYKLVGEIAKNGKSISTNTFEIYIGNPLLIQDKDKLKIQLFDPSGYTKNALLALGLNVQDISDLNKLSKNGILVFGKNSFQSDVDVKPVQKFVANGGRVLVFNQDSKNISKLNTLLPVDLKGLNMDIDNSTYPPPLRPSHNGFNINPEQPEHPVFKGLKREHLKLWSDYSGWDERKQGFPDIYPVENGFVVDSLSSFENISVLANYSVGLEGLGLIEVFNGKGSYLISGFELISRTKQDPVSDRLLLNMLGYMSESAEHKIHPFIDSHIVWGDYESEKGLLTGISSGFMLNSKPLLTGMYKNKPLVVKEEGHLFAERPGGWNNRPGIQYVPYGRRAFGPYYHRGFGGIPEAYNYGSDGQAEFWCRLPSDAKFMKTLVWNPSEENLTVVSAVNGQEVVQNIPPGQMDWIQNVFQHKLLNHIVYSADRRVVFLETKFD
ncbi:glycoside hydrolase family 2 TIM barrel-domain containing protein [Reichenbachiella sp. MALMAid0571]|uniref:glycoside hydrolase family 2 TIM barrel-domain containing protein n=1 Tax=Reichenbachiella sp. MALMAid0571 TaxID=3143939 RepID=UPI0032DFF84C